MKLKLPVRPGSEENQEILEYREITADRCQSLKIAHKKKKLSKLLLTIPQEGILLKRHPNSLANKFNTFSFSSTARTNHSFFS